MISLARCSKGRRILSPKLFSRPAPTYLDQNSDAEEIFRAFAAVRSDPKLYENNMKRIAAQLQLSPEDEKTVESVYQVFYSVGPDLNYASVSPYAPAGPSTVTWSPSWSPKRSDAPEGAVTCPADDAASASSSAASCASSSASSFGAS
jgi:hypothetical protein